MNSHSHMFNLEKLNGRDNFATWKFTARTYLEHEGLWNCVEPKEGQVVEPAKDILAKSKLILLVNSQNYVHIQDCKTATEVWTNLHKAFDDNGLTRKVGLLKELINTSLESSSGIEEYVSKIMNAAHKLRNIDFDVNDEWLGTLMLAGLPDRYKPMIMGLENSGVTISADLIKTKLLQEIVSSDTNNALYSYTKKGKFNAHKSKPTKGPRCYNCNGYGHLAKYCTGKGKRESHKQENSSFAAAFSATAGEIKKQWYVDSGASMHMCGNKEWMYNLRAPSVKSITVANSEPLSVEGTGEINLNILQGGTIQLKNVLYVPGLAANLMSVSTITKSGYRVIFNEKGCNINDANGKFICSATLNNKLYVLDMQSKEETVHLASSLVSSNNIRLWHLRMAHLNVSDLQKLPNYADGVVLDQNKQVRLQCSSCCEGKQARLPFKQVGTRATKPLELIHSDLCGPMENASYGGMRYFINFIDDYTRMVHVYFTKDKLSILEIFKDYKRYVENQLDSKIKMLRTDNGKEYCNGNFERYLANCGIIHQTSAPYTPQQNGLSERMNRTLVEKARCMISNANLEKPVWAEAVATAAYIINRSPTKALDNTTPYQMWTGRKPELSHMRIFGSETMVHVPKERRQKWDKKSEKMIFVGYCERTKGYRVMHPKTHQIMKSRDVIFFEKPGLCDEFLISARSTEEDRLGLSEESKPDDQSKELEAASSSQPVDCKHSLKEAENDSSSEYETDTADDPDADETYYPPKHITVQEQGTRNITLRPRNKDKKGMFCLYTGLSDPQTVEEALSSTEVKEWKQAMDAEMNSLMENETWNLVKLPPGKIALPNKWVFKRKTNQQGEVMQYKARLVIKGYAQKKGVDFQEVYSPVVRWTSIRYLFALAAQQDLYIYQMDAVSAFLQGSIDTDIYMVQPEMYKKGDEVCHLNKSIYGLKQASRLWNTKLSTVLKEMGIQQSKTDPCIYFNINIGVYIAIWVDDILLFCSQRSTINNIKEKLQQKLNMKDLGEVSQCLGLNITRSKDSIMLDQEKYIKEILIKFNMSECKSIKTPVEVGQKFNENTEVEMDCPYQQAIGSLLYVAQGTRPDISYVINALSRFNKEPRSEHWSAIKRVMRYLQGTKDYKLTYTKSGNRKITGYCDADWASDARDRKSCTGYIFLFQGSAISWCSRKQQTIALSTAEAEYMAMGSAAQEALWLRQLQAEVGRGSDTLLIYCDNQSAIKLSANDCYLPRSKHIDIRYHFIKDHVINNNLKFCYVKGCENVSDILTKGTTVEKHMYCVTNMGLRSGEDVRNIGRIGTQSE